MSNAIFCLNFFSNPLTFFYEFLFFSFNLIIFSFNLIIFSYNFLAFSSKIYFPSFLTDSYFLTEFRKYMDILKLPLFEIQCSGFLFLYQILSLIRNLFSVINWKLRYLTLCSIQNFFIVSSIKR